MIKKLKRWWFKLRKSKPEVLGEMELDLARSRDLWQANFDAAIFHMWIDETIPDGSTMRMMIAAAVSYANLALDAHETRWPS